MANISCIPSRFLFFQSDMYIHVYYNEKDLYVLLCESHTSVFQWTTISWRCLVLWLYSWRPKHWRPGVWRRTHVIIQTQSPWVFHSRIPQQKIFIPNPASPHVYLLMAASLLHSIHWSKYAIYLVKVVLLGLHKMLVWTCGCFRRQVCLASVWVKWHYTHKLILISINGTVPV